MKRLIAKNNYPDSAYEWVSKKVEELRKTSELQENELYRIAWEQYKTS